MQMLHFNLFPTDIWVSNCEATPFEYSRIEQIGKYFVGDRIGFFTIGKRSYKQEWTKYRINAVVLDWSWKYQYEHMVFNICANRYTQK